MECCGFHGIDGRDMSLCLSEVKSYGFRWCLPPTTAARSTSRAPRTITPLRGGKYSDFEGGVRTTTFISGGYVPSERRGQVHSGVVSVADWYTIFSELAQVDPEDTQALEANKWLKEQGLSLLAPVDGKKGQLQAIFSGQKGPRDDVPLFLSSQALLQLPYKLVTGKQPYMVHTGPLYPNCSTIGSMRAGKGPRFHRFQRLGREGGLGRQLLLARSAPFKASKWP